MLFRMFVLLLSWIRRHASSTTLLIVVSDD